MSINLLPSEAKFQANRIAFKKKMVKLVYTLVAVWLGLIVITFVAWIVIRQLYLNGTSVMAKSEEAYGKLSSHLITNQKLRYKVKLVSSILDKRFGYGKAFRTITNLFPQEVSLTRFELKDGGVFAVEAEATGFGVMDEAEKRILEINQGKSVDFKSAELKQLSVLGNVWKFSLDVNLK